MALPVDLFVFHRFSVKAINLNENIMLVLDVVAASYIAEKIIIKVFDVVLVNAFIIGNVEQVEAIR